MKKTTKLFLLKLTYLTSLGIIITELMTYPGFVSNYAYFGPLFWLLVAVLVHVFIRYRYKIRLGDGFSWANLVYAAPVALILFTSTMVLEGSEGLYANYFFANFKIYFPAFSFLFMGFILFSMTNMTKAFIFKYKKELLYYFAFAASLASLSLYFSDPLYYADFVREDGPVEYLTALAYLLSGIISLKIAYAAKGYFKSSFDQRIFYYLFILMAIFSFFVTGEEISWGQRIIGWDTPEAMEAVNLQDETNLHNTIYFWPFVYIGYLAIGLYGSFMWIIKWLASSFDLSSRARRWMDILMPDPHLFIYFFLIVIYVWLRFNHGPWRYQLWEELTELFLGVGILLHLVRVYYLDKRIKTP